MKSVLIGIERVIISDLNRQVLLCTGVAIAIALYDTVLSSKPLSVYL